MAKKYLADNQEFVILAKHLIFYLLGWARTAEPKSGWDARNQI